MSSESRRTDVEGTVYLRPCIDLINAEENARIRELIAAKTWPQKWDGTEPTGDVPLDRVFADGTVQPLMWEGC